MASDINKIQNFCLNNFDLKNAILGNEYFYQSLPLCVIDAVFSIGIKYTTTQKIVNNYCNYFKLKQFRDSSNNDIPKIEEQQPISELIKSYEKLSVDYFTQNVFCNRNRTSATNGILKSEAVYEFAKVLEKYHINYFQDIHKLYANEIIKNEIMTIKGQTSGICYKYFLMLAGDNNYIRPDRHILKFLSTIVGYNIEIYKAELLLKEVCQNLKVEYPALNLRILDYKIWDYQRQQ